MKKVFITGASGFIGTHLATLLAKDSQVFALYRNDHPDIPNVTWIKGDLLDNKTYQHELSKCKFAIHCAGMSAYHKKYYDQMNRVNIDGTAAFIEAAQQSSKLQKMIYISSVVTLGVSEKPTPITEDDRTDKLLNFGYIQSKKRAEDLIYNAIQNHKLPAVIIHPSAVYGPTDVLKPARSTQLKIMKGKVPFYSKGGLCVVHIEDLCNGILLALEKGQIGENYILGGENISLKTFFKELSFYQKSHASLIPSAFIKLLGRFGQTLDKIKVPFPFLWEQAKLATVYHWYDSQKAQKDLGYKYRSAHLALRSSLDWAKENKHLEA